MSKRGEGGWEWAEWEVGEGCEGIAAGEAEDEVLELGADGRGGEGGDAEELEEDLCRVEGELRQGAQNEAEAYDRLRKVHLALRCCRFGGRSKSFQLIGEVLGDAERRRDLGRDAVVRRKVLSEREAAKVGCRSCRPCCECERGRVEVGTLRKGREQISKGRLKGWSVSHEGRSQSQITEYNGLLLHHPGLR